MSDASVLDIAWAFAAGVLGGAAYFAGLWLTVCRITRTRHPIILVFTSMLLRMVALLLGFYFIMHGRWERLLACLAGVLLARALAIRKLRPIHQESVLAGRKR
jgi:F1F0 ATPase subunit 2